jgi:hypothetical protein
MKEEEKRREMKRSWRMKYDKKALSSNVGICVCSLIMKTSWKQLIKCSVILFVWLSDQLKIEKASWLAEERKLAAIRRLAREMKCNEIESV